MATNPERLEKLETLYTKECLAAAKHSEQAKKLKEQIEITRAGRIQKAVTALNLSSDQFEALMKLVKGKEILDVLEQIKEKELRKRKELVEEEEAADDEE